MIAVVIYQNKRSEIVGFCVNGHANYDEKGKDIVCSAVSVLTMNTINSLKSFTNVENKIEINGDEEHPTISCILKDIDGQKDPLANVLFNALYLGLKDLSTQYSEYITVSIRRCDTCSN